MEDNEITVRIEPLIGLGQLGQEVNKYEDAIEFEPSMYDSIEDDPSIIGWGVYISKPNSGEMLNLFDCPTKDNAEAAQRIIEALLKAFYEATVFDPEAIFQLIKFELS